MNTYLLVDESEGLLRLLARLLREVAPEVEVRAVRTWREAQGYLVDHEVAGVLVDPDAFDRQGASLVSLARRLQPEARVVAFSMRMDDPALHAAFQLGAAGYLLKTESELSLRNGLRQLVAGEPALSPAVAQRLVAQVLRPLQSAEQEAAALTPRETDVLQRVAKGFTNVEISRQLGLSAHTVTDYLKGVYRKLNISSRVEAAMEATRLGLVAP